MTGIKNIIFDLGGVILNIDFKRTERAFEELGFPELSRHITQFHITPFWEDYEVGRIDDAAFIEGVKKHIPQKCGDEQVVAAWNSLLLDFPPERIEFLRSLKGKYRLFLLSNTNSLHHAEFQRRFTEQTGEQLDDIFEKVYYSHAVNLRKPLRAIYQLVIDENGLVPSETLFIDDTHSNFSGAEQAGLKTYHLTGGKTIMDIGL